MLLDDLCVSIVSVWEDIGTGRCVFEGAVGNLKAV